MPTKAKMPSVDTQSSVKYKVARALVFNILKNVQFVIEACNCKTIQESHLKAVSAIQSSIVQNNIGYIPKDAKKPKGQSGGGGAIVLPSQYFNPEASGTYIDIAEVSKMETQLFNDSAYARAEHPIKFGGGRSSSNVPITMLKEIFDEYQKKNKIAFRVSKGATSVIKTSVDANMSKLFNELGGDEGVTLKNVRDHVATNGNWFHLRSL